MAGYIGTTPVPQATQHRESFTATGGQTSFATVGYTPQFIDVYLNGVKLAPADFTATNGSDVVLASGATASDILEIVAYTPFEIASQTFTGDTTANNFAVTGTFTSRGIDDNADAVAITIDSSENVGIGTSTPRTGLHLYGAGQTNSAISDAGSLGAFLRVSDTGAAGGAGGGVVFGTNASEADGFAGFAAIKGLLSNGNDRTIGALAFSTRASTTDTALTERMRLTSDGNLLVGKTSVNATDIGIVANANGRLYTAVDGNSNVFNRTTSDGDILDFRKDGTTVGSIGAKAGDLVIGTTITSLRFNNGLDVIHPFNQTSGLGSDANTDLGASSARFKDLYLSGGVVFDAVAGNATSNTLDDYEEGTFTPVLRFNQTNYSGTYNDQLGKYTKIGNAVHYRLLVQLGSYSQTGDIDISGLPFTATSTTHTSVAIYKARVVHCQGLVIKNTAKINLYDINDNTSDSTLLTHSDMGTTPYFQISGFYHTDQ
jgi:hypothetical protein